MRSPTKTLIDALRKLAHDIQSDDGVANACIGEAADRLEELMAIDESREWLRQAREALYTLWLHAGSVRMTNTQEWMEWMEGEVLPDAKAFIDELDGRLA